MRSDRSFIITSLGEKLPWPKDGYVGEPPFVAVHLRDNADDAAIEFRARDILHQLLADPDKGAYWTDYDQGVVIWGIHQRILDPADPRQANANLPRLLVDGGHPSTFDFLRGAHPGREGFLELRAFDAKVKGGPPAGREFIPLPLGPDGEARVRRFALRFQLKNDLYHAIATRRDTSSGRLDNCSELWTLYAEFDTKRGTSIGEIWRRVKSFPLAPSAVVHSGGGLHVYWFLAEALDLRADLGMARAYRWLGDLVHHLGAERESAEPARVLRIPDTLNQKYPNAVVTMLTFRPDLRYSAADVIAVLGDADPNAEPAAVDSDRATSVDHGLDRDDRISRARAYLQRQPPAIEGQGGDTWTFQVCADVAIGHDLSVDDALVALAEWNARCSPPWPPRELRQKLRNAIRYGSGQRGAKLVDHPTTEVGDAEFFAECYADRVRFDHRRGRWLVASPSGLWTPDPIEQLRGFAVATMRERQRRALLIDDPKRKKAALNWSIAGEQSRRLDHLLREARALPAISDVGDTWDSNAWLLGVPNGVVDLTTGTLRQARPEDRITMRASVEYDATAICPLWESTIADIFNKDAALISYIQRALGYSITGDCREECLFLCWGDGANGKGTLMNTFGTVLRDYADDLPFSALELHERSGIPNDVAKLVGKRFVTASESGQTVRLNEARIKALTGRDPITARFMRQEWFTFQPDAKFWLATNKKPIVRDDSTGFWRRIHLIPFTQSFVGRENKTLKDALRKEAPGILAWAVRGALAWQQEGLNPPAVVRNATDEYRRESEHLTPFYEDRCVVQDGAHVQASALFAEYVNWCDARRIRGRLSTVKFPQEVRKRFEVDPTQKRHVVFLGIGLRSSQAEGPGDEAAPEVTANDLPF